MVDSLVYCSVTCAPALAVSVVVSKLNGLLAGVPTVSWLAPGAGAAPPDGFDVGVGWAVAGADAPIRRATSCGVLATPTGTSSVSPATEMNPLTPPGAWYDQT